MKRLQKTSLGVMGAVALLAAAPAANAADINDSGISVPDAVEYAPTPGWKGFYLGANLGASWDDSDNIEVVDDAELIGGAHMGYNWQGKGNVVIGVEGDISFLDSDDVDYLATARVRMGLAFGNKLIYATGGAAVIDLDGVEDTGFVAGLGAEYKIRDNVSLGVEGLYYGFEDDAGDDANFYAARARITYHFGGGRGLLK